MSVFSDWKFWVSTTVGLGGVYVVTADEQGGLSAQAIRILKDVFGWFLNPSGLIDLGFKAFGAVMEAMGSIMPGTVGDQFVNFGTSLSGAPVSKAVAVVGYMASPVIDPALFLACLGILLNAWLVLLIVRLVILVKGHFWSAGA